MSLSIGRISETIYHTQPIVQFGWYFSTNNQGSEYVTFNSMRALKQFVDEAIDLLPELLDRKDVIPDEWAVALAMLRQNASDTDSYIGDDDYSDWCRKAFGDENCSDMADDWEEKLQELVWAKRFTGSLAGDPAVRLLNMYLYLSKAPPGVRRAARRMGLSGQPSDAVLHYEESAWI